MATETKNNPVSDTQESTEVRPPRRFNVLFHNDDYTPMEFVMEVLMVFFNKSPQAAISLTEEVHVKGKAIVATLPKNIAQMKVKQVLEAATMNEYPLKCTMEAE